FHPVEHHGMSAKLLVKMDVRALPQQVEIEIGQDRGEAVRVLDLDLPVAVARAQAVMSRPIAQATFEEARIVDAVKVALMALIVDDRHFLGIGKEDTYHRCAVFQVRAEVAEWVGMTTLDDRIGFRCERAHCAASSERERMRQVPANGTRSQSGRCASAYSIS